MEERSKALGLLGSRALLDAIPAMRASFARDVSSAVRSAAAHALASVIDVESTGAFVRLLQQRDSRSAEAKTAAHALGKLGDVRGLDELLRAYAEGWQPGIVAEAVREFGPAALEPLVDLVESKPELAERKAALGVIATLPADDVAAVIMTRLEKAVGWVHFCERAGIYVTIANAHPGLAARVASRILELRPVLLDKKACSTQEKALARKCAKHRTSAANADA